MPVLFLLLSSISCFVPVVAKSPALRAHVNMEAEAGGERVGESLIFTDRFEAPPVLWRSYGPFGGRVDEVEVAPTAPSTLYLGTRNGLFKSTDSAATWQRVAGDLPRRRIQDLAVDPTDSDIVYAAMRPELYKSENGGETWEELDIELSDTDYGGVTIDIDPNDSQSIKVADTEGEGILQSSDGGLTWGQLNSDYLPSIESFALLQDDRERIVASSRQDGISRFHLSSDGGITWNLAGLYLSSQQFLSLGDGVVVSIGSYFRAGALKSLDAGESWSELLIDCPVENLEDQRIYSLSEAQSGGFYAASDQGVYYISSDFESCSLISQNLILEQQPDRTVMPFSIATDPVDEDALYVGSVYAGLFETMDGGQSWTRVSQGIKATEIQAVASHPENPDVVLAAGMGTPSAASDLFWSSEDAGQSWEVKSHGLNLPGVQGIAVDSGPSAELASSHLYAVGRASVVLGGEWVDHSGVFKSEDGGSSWSESGVGVEVIPAHAERGGAFTLPPDPERHAVVIDHNGPRNESGFAEVVYVAGNALSEEDASGCSLLGHRIYKSLDAGESWDSADSGLPVSCPFEGVVQVRDIVIDPTDSSTLYAGTYAFREVISSETNYPENGVFKSIDGGATWELKSNGIPMMGGEESEGHWDINALAISESDPNTLYAIAEEAYYSGLGDDGPETIWYPSVVYKSVDSGASWFEANDGIPSASQIQAIEVDPSDPDVVYVTSTPNVYRTTDGGTSWLPYGEIEKISGAKRLELSGSGKNSVLYVGGFGGVFRSERGQSQ